MIVDGVDVAGVEDVADGRVSQLSPGRRIVRGVPKKIVEEYGHSYPKCSYCTLNNLMCQCSTLT